MKVKRWLLIIIGLLILLLVLIYLIVLHPRLPIVNGYAAKKVCSCSYIANRKLNTIVNEDLNFFPVNYTKSKVDEDEKSVTSSFFGLTPRKAIYREGFGCTLLPMGEKFNEFKLPSVSDKKERIDSLFWPLTDNLKDTIFTNIDYDVLNQAITKTIGNDIDPELTGTRAIVVVYKNQIISETYAPGFDKDTEILGWSMTKSIINTLTGILVKEGKMDLDETHLYEEWENDERKEISLDNLLQMSSGLDWEEEYSTMSDVTKMLYKAADIPDQANDPNLIHKPGDVWYYSSGTTNLISGLIRSKFENLEEYLLFPRKALFDKINMNSAVMELDASGNFIGSSYCFATPRDWAKFGLLYLNNGNWFGDRILTEEWIEYTRTTTPNSKGEYGAHFWHNENGVAYPDAPHDIYSANGFQGQRVFIIPSKDMVIVRMGLTDSSEFDFNKFLKRIISCVN